MIIIPVIILQYLFKQLLLTGIEHYLVPRMTVRSGSVFVMLVVTLVVLVVIVLVKVVVLVVWVVLVVIVLVKVEVLVVLVVLVVIVLVKVVVLVVLVVLVVMSGEDARPHSPCRDLALSQLVSAVD